jgi:uncharacterized protein (DUF4415 family)
MCIGSHANMDSPHAADPLAASGAALPTAQPATAVADAVNTEQPDQPSFDLTVDALEAQDTVRWNGRMMSELSDPDLMTAAQGLPATEAPAATLTLPARERSWLKLHVTWPEKRVPLSLRVDTVVLDWFRRGGPGFQARMNAVLRAYVEAQIDAETKRR